MDIKQLIGEATEYDKKAELETKRPKSWCKSVSAFANGIGGTLVFGVTNDDRFIGLANAEKDAELISEHIKTHLNPIPDFVLSFKNIDNKKFVIVDVKAGEQTPYYYEGDGQLIAFVRVGNESVPAEPIKLRELVLKGSGETYDALKSKYDYSDMAFTKLKSVYKQRTGNTFDDTDYESFGILDEKGNLTNAGALLADESPVKHSRLFCTRWNGLDKAAGVLDALDDKEYSGGLVVLLQAGLDFVKNNSKKPWGKTGNGRTEKPDYPERAILEGLVNALIHRNYLQTGSEVHIDMFDDRIEIYSPGGMVSGISLKDKDIMKIPSKRRNPILADIFNRLRYMERRGSGFKKIMLDYEKQPGYSEKVKPLFEADSNDFLLTLFNLNYLEDENVGENVGENQHNIYRTKIKELWPECSMKKVDNVLTILQLMLDNPQISADEMKIKMGLTTRTVERYLSDMKRRNIIDRLGPDKGGSWKVLL